MNERLEPGGPPADDDRWCDLSCPWAAFPNDVAVDGSLSCRTFRALHCGRLGRLVTQNARCALRREPPGGAPPDGRS